MSDLQTDGRIKRLEQSNAVVPLYQLAPFEGDSRVPLVTGLEVISFDRTSGASKATLRFQRPEDPQVDHFEVWVNRTAYQTENPYMVASVGDSPVSFTVNADQDTDVVAFVRTVMKSGLGSDFSSSPTTTFHVFKFVAQSDEIGSGVVGDTHLDRAIIPIQIRDSDLDRTVHPIQIRDGDLDRTSGNKIQIVNGDIVSLDTAKLTNGLFNVTVNAPAYKAGGVAGVSVTTNIVIAVNVTTATLQYKDWAGNNQSATIVTAVTPIAVSHSWTQGIMTA